MAEDLLVWAIFWVCVVKSFGLLLNLENLSLPPVDFCANAS